MSSKHINTNQKTVVVVLLVCLQFAIFSPKVIEAKRLAKEDHPLLYLGPFTTQCGTDSPEYFYRDVALPAISTLHEETKGFFGILMDRLESATTEDESEEDDKEKLEKKWLFVMETVQDSLDRAIKRIQSIWGILVGISDTPEMPWEAFIKSPLEKEFLNEMEYEYAMIEAIVKAGVKEIVSTLQKQLTKVIRTLEKHVEKLTKNGEEITEMKLLSKMEKSLNKMEPNFIGNLLKKIVAQGITSRSGSTPKNSSKTNKTFLSDTMQDTAIVFEAYRKKGTLFPNFWTEITQIMKPSSPLDVEDFIDLYSSNEELFIENVILILTSSDKLSS